MSESEEIKTQNLDSGDIEKRPDEDVAASSKDKNLETDLNKIIADKSKEKPPMEEILKYYILPIGMFVLSFAMIIFAILPLIGDISQRLNDINAQQDEYERLTKIKTEREKLNSLSNQQEADLAKINSIIPESDSAVVDFSEDIKDTAEKNSLRLNNSIVGEIATTDPNNINTFGADAEKGLELVELPAEFTITGRFESVQSFLRDIFGGKDFIIIKEMELRKQLTAEDVDIETGEQSTAFSKSTSNNWIMNIVLVKYQFRPAGDTTEQDLLDYYFAVPETIHANEEVLKFVNENY